METFSKEFLDILKKNFEKDKREGYIKDDTEYVKSIYDKFNKKFLNSELDTYPVSISVLDNGFGKVLYNAKGIFGVVINYFVVCFGDSPQIYSAIAHEMCHVKTLQDIFEKYGSDSEGLNTALLQYKNENGHTKEWQDTANDINEHNGGKFTITKTVDDSVLESMLDSEDDDDDDTFDFEYKEIKQKNDLSTVMDYLKQYRT